jgi:uncharacterized lipoprotein
MKAMNLSIFLIGTVLLLIGCKTIGRLDKSDEYKKALPRDQSLILPSDINGNAIEDRYPVPKAESSKKPAAPVLIIPPECKL